MKRQHSPRRVVLLFVVLLSVSTSLGPAIPDAADPRQVFRRLRVWCQRRRPGQRRQGNQRRARCRRESGRRRWPTFAAGTISPARSSFDRASGFTWTKARRSNSRPTRPTIPSASTRWEEPSGDLHRPARRPRPARHLHHQRGTYLRRPKLAWWPWARLHPATPPRSFASLAKPLNGRPAGAASSARPTPPLLSLPVRADPLPSASCSTA